RFEQALAEIERLGSPERLALPATERSPRVAPNRGPVARGFQPSGSPYIHAANSAALLRDRRVWYDGVRPGLLLYGLVPPPLASTCRPATRSSSSAHKAPIGSTSARWLHKLVRSPTRSCRESAAGLRDCTNEQGAENRLRLRTVRIGVAEVAGQMSGLRRMEFVR